MTQDEAKDLIYNLVASRQGCKPTELAADEGILPILKEHDLIRLLTEMVAEGMLLEIEFNLSTIPYRLKSFLLPGKEKDLLGLHVRCGGRESIYK